MFSPCSVPSLRAFLRLAFCSVLLLIFASTDRAQALDQWADEVLGFSSQYSDGAWAAYQALGPSDTPDYGDSGNAWTASSQDGTLEYVTVGFAIPVHANGVTVRETWGNGFVYRVDVIDMAGTEHEVWSGTDPSQPDAPADYRVNWTQTNFPVRGVKIYIDTDASANWEEIDSIQLHGAPIDYAQWAGRVKAFSSQWSDDAWAAMQATGAPDTYAYGDISTAWAPAPTNGTQEFLRLDYDAPVYATGVLVRETLGNGCVTRVDLVDTDNNLHTVWTGADPSPRDTPANFRVNFAQTAYLVKGVVVHIDTDTTDYWEELDAVALFGVLPGGLSGCLWLEEVENMAVPITLEFRPVPNGVTITRQPTLNPDGSFFIAPVPAGDYRIAVKGAKWLRKVVERTVTSGAPLGFLATLLGADADNSNTIDVEDLSALIISFDANPTSSNWLGGAADFNCDNIVDVEDLAMLIRNFDAAGDS